MSRYAIHNKVNSYSTHGILIRSVGKNQCVLDVGCNEGYIGRACDPSNTFYGVDNDSESLAVAKEHYADVAQINLNQCEKLPWDLQFDLILFGDVLEHLVDPLPVYQMLIKNYLKKGGRIVVSLPNIANWQIRMNLLFGKFDYQNTGILDRTHLHFYTYTSAKKAFEIEGYHISKATGGSNFLGTFIRLIPFTKKLFAHSIIMVLEKNNSRGE